MGECVCGLCVCGLSAKRGPQMEMTSITITGYCSNLRRQALRKKA